MHPTFAARRDQLNTLYDVTLQFNARVIGGIPAVNVAEDDDSPEGEKKSEKARNIMDAWLNKALEDKRTPEEIAEMAEQTFAEAYRDAEAQASTTFKADDTGLYLEGRAVKAMLKEAGSRMGFGKAIKAGATGKGRPSLKQDLHEALHVDEDVIYLTRDGAVVTEPDGYETRPIHVIGPQGPRTSIKKCAFVEHATISFTVRVLKSCGVTEEILVDILAFAQDLGLGADRSQGNGKFEVVVFGKQELAAAA